MNAFEFNARIHNGTIKIPEQYKSMIGDKVKVIILTGANDSKKEFRGFNSIKIKTKGFKFDREVANER